MPHYFPLTEGPAERLAVFIFIEPRKFQFEKPETGMPREGKRVNGNRLV